MAFVRSKILATLLAFPSFLAFTLYPTAIAFHRTHTHTQSHTLSLIDAQFVHFEGIRVSGHKFELRYICCCCCCFSCFSVAMLRQHSCFFTCLSLSLFFSLSRKWKFIPGWALWTTPFSSLRRAPNDAI